MSPWNCSAVLDGQLYTHSRSHWLSTSAFCHWAEVGRTALSIEQFRSSALFCGGPVDLEFPARQSSRPRTESRYFQSSAEDIHFCEILMTKCIQRIRDLFEYALYKFTLYLLYLLTYFQNRCKQWGWVVSGPKFTRFYCPTWEESWVIMPFSVCRYPNPFRRYLRFKSASEQK